jgi:hypothetical protein
VQDFIWRPGALAAGSDSASACDDVDIEEGLKAVMADDVSGRRIVKKSDPQEPDHSVH